MGINIEEKFGKDSNATSPEELAAQEAERERLLQESMQAEVINSVMRRLETDLKKNEDRMKESINVINEDLGKRFQLQESNISSSIKNLE